MMRSVRTIKGPVTAEYEGLGRRNLKTTMRNVWARKKKKTGGKKKTREEEEDILSLYVIKAEHVTFSAPRDKSYG